MQCYHIHPDAGKEHISEKLYLCCAYKAEFHLKVYLLNEDDDVQRVITNADISVERGCNYCHEKINEWGGFGNMLSDGAAAAAEADIAILALGLDCSIEGEDTGFDNDYTSCGDKRTLYLPATQQKLAEMVCDACENVIVVILCGSSVDLGEKVRNHAKAIIHAWYPGSQGGLAIAKTISGENNPCGKLPVTIYDGEHPLPDFQCGDRLDYHPRLFGHERCARWRRPG